MTSQHFCDIQSRRDFFRNCAGGIGTIGSWGLLTTSTCLGIGCQTIGQTGEPKSDYSQAVDYVALNTAILDSMLSEGIYFYVRRVTLPLRDSVESRAAQIKLRNHDLRPLIAQLLQANKQENIVNVASNRRNGNYELVDEWPDDLQDGENICGMSCPVFDAKSNLGLVVLMEDGRSLNGWERVALFRFRDGRIKELRNRLIWIS